MTLAFESFVIDGSGVQHRSHGPAVRGKLGPGVECAGAGGEAWPGA